MAVKPKKSKTALAEMAEMATDQMTASVESLELPSRNGVPSFSLEAIADISRENIAALTKSNLALAGGLQAMTEEILGYARTTVSNASQAASALLGARTFDEVVHLNTELAKSSLETMLARSARLSEMGVAVASETFAPLGGRVEATFAKLTKSAA